MKKILLVMGLFSFLGFSFRSGLTTFHDFTVKDIEGKDFPLSQLKGKKVLVVNVASECGYTPQYKELQLLYTNYKDSNFTIIGFPCNQFGGQEPGTEKDIKSFCEKNYGVTFPLMSKIDVGGENIAPVYKWLTTKEENGINEEKVKWNFNKFMIDEEGKFAGYLPSKVKPMDRIITDWIMDR